MSHDLHSPGRSCTTKVRRSTVHLLNVHRTWPAVRSGSFSLSLRNETLVMHYHKRMWSQRSFKRVYQLASSQCVYSQLLRQQADLLLVCPHGQPPLPLLTANVESCDPHRCRVSERCLSPKPQTMTPAASQLQQKAAHAIRRVSQTVERTLQESDAQMQLAVPPLLIPSTLSLSLPSSTGGGPAAFPSSSSSTSATSDKKRLDMARHRLIDVNSACQPG